MRNIVKTALFISVPFSVVAGLFSYIATLNFITILEDGSAVMLSGLAGVRYLIKMYGLIPYFASLLPQFSFFIGTIFLALVMHGCIQRSIKRNIIKTALFVSLPYTLVVGVLSYIVTIDILVGTRDGEPAPHYVGLDAVRWEIEATGLVPFLASLIPQFSFFIGTIFLALVIQGYIYLRRINA